MSDVLAVLMPEETTGDVLTAASALAAGLGGHVVPLRSTAGDAITAAAEATGVGATALRLDPALARGDVDGPISAALLVDKPVLVVPEHTALPRHDHFERALTPLEGSTPSSASVAGILEELVRRGTQIVAVHVLGPGSAPPFWDQSGHAAQTWGAEFLCRWCDVADVDLHLRRGEVGPALLEVVTQTGADLVVLGWSRVVSPARAAVVRGVLAGVRVPVLLAPVVDAGTNRQHSATERASL